MKRLFLTFTMTMICIGVIMAQEQDTVDKEVVKSRDFKMFGEGWHYEKYEDKTFDRNNMFANNYRYGARLALGVGGTDFFFNYDLNEYFQKDKGPRVNAISFGIIL